MTGLWISLIAALLTAGAAYWVLRAYRRGGGGASRPALVACGAAALAALGVYLVIGRPDLPDAPYLARMEALKQRDPTSYNVDEALAVLAEAAKDNPSDPLPYFYSGQLLFGDRRAEEAARAFEAALRRQPQFGEAMLGLGRAVVEIEGGRITPEALALFQQAGALTNDPAPWLYQATAAIQDDRGADARRFWAEALVRMAPDDPRREMARRMSTGEEP